MKSRRTTRRSPPTARDYPRTARLNELLREILAEQLERIDDDRLDVVTVTSVEVEPDLRRAVVFYDCLDGEAGDEDAMAALTEARVRLQGAVARQSRTKRTPELSFRPDPAVRSGARIEEILRDIGPIDTGSSASAELAGDESAESADASGKPMADGSTVSAAEPIADEPAPPMADGSEPGVEHEDADGPEETSPA